MESGQSGLHPTKVTWSRLFVSWEAAALRFLSLAHSPIDLSLASALTSFVSGQVYCRLSFARSRVEQPRIMYPHQDAKIQLPSGLGTLFPFRRRWLSTNPDENREKDPPSTPSLVFEPFTTMASVRNSLPLVAPNGLERIGFSPQGLVA